MSSIKQSGGYSIRLISSLQTLLAALALAILPMLSSGMASAQTPSASITLLASAPSVLQGHNFTVTASASSSDPISGAQAYITWDANRLSFVGANYGNSPWTNDTGDTHQGADYYVASHFKLPSFPNSGTVVVLEFQAKSTGTGSTSIGMNGASSFLSSGTSGAIMTTSVAGTSITVNAPAPPSNNNPTPPAPGTTNPSSPTTSGSSTPATTASNAAAVAAQADPTATDPTEAANTTIIAGKEKDDEAGKVASVSSTKKSTKIPLPVMLGAGALLLATAVFFTVRQLIASRQGASMSSAASGNTEPPVVSTPGSSLSSTPPDAPGTVIKPTEPTDKQS